MWNISRGNVSRRYGHRQINIRAFLNDKLEEWYNCGNEPSEQIYSVLKNSIALIIQEYAAELSQRYSCAITTPNYVIDLVKDRIENSLGKNCSMALLAKYSGYSESRLMHIFKEQTGITIGQYIDKVRLRFLKRAKISSLKQKEIAFELGFKSHSAFSTWLKNIQR